MPLNDQQTQQVSQWLNSKKSYDFACPVCNSKNFSVGDIVMAPSFSGGGMAIGGPGVPMVQVICKNCAHVLLFAAVPIGLMS